MDSAQEYTLRQEENRVITQSRLKEVLHYDPETGVFTWLAQTGNRIKIGDIAGAVGAAGHRYVGVDRKLYFSHRLAWLYVTGSWPRNQIDHRNGVRDDNRIANLREAAPGQNQQNIKLPSTNKSGFMGVSWSRQKRKWAAHIMLAKRSKYLGYFTTPEDAHAAYLAAKADLHTFQPVPRDFTA